MPNRSTKFLRRVYYWAKPFIPLGLRWALRRSRARRILARSADVWPINQDGDRKPDGWPGWPDGRRFAVVLTHDVETQAGVDKVRRLAEMEMELDFRSSFNFIPEGTYRVPAELRGWLAEHGFEVGVHDLHHDGRLYDSRQGFQKKARRINHYLAEWGASGFRSGFMLRELDWLHDLDLDYDASTFDTDPFEPQPDGCRTIFPFRVPGPHGEGRPGYVELPYTLPQDSTLFLLLAEKSPEIWQRKLDWIVERGGLALLNVHPDYLRFDGEENMRDTYPVEHYRRLLLRVKEDYGENCWQPLARDMAAYAAKVLPAGPERPRRRICMATFSFYESDNRVLRYAEALAARGDSVDVLALRRAPDLPDEEIINGVRVVRIQNRFDKSRSSRIGHLLPVLRFVKRAAGWMRRSHAREPYDLLHIHNMPDFVVFAGWYPKWKGAKIILDIHDIVPEFYANKFGQRNGGTSMTLLKWMERASARFSDHVIISNHLWLEKYARRTGTMENCSAFINNVDSSVFVPAQRLRRDGKLIIVFPGSLQWHQGVDVAIAAFTQVRAELPNAEFHIYGDGIAKESLRQQAAEAGLNGSVRFFEPRSLREIAEIMADADLGVVPKRADSFGNEAYSTKIMEFMSVGVPVVVSSTRIDRHYFDESVVRFFESGNVDALAREMLDLLRADEVRRNLVARASEFARRNNWETRKSEYLGLVDSLCRRS